MKREELEVLVASIKAKIDESVTTTAELDAAYAEGVQEA